LREVFFLDECLGLSSDSVAGNERGVSGLGASVLTATVVEGGRWWWIIGEGVFSIADLFLLHPQLNGILVNKEIQYKSRMISATCISDSDHFEEDFLCFFIIVN
jgi:hypothetical protein